MSQDLDQSSIILNLPLELELHILSFLEPKDLAKMDCVCRKWRWDLNELQWRFFHTSCFGGAYKTHLTWKQSFCQTFNLIQDHLCRSSPLLQSPLLEIPQFHSSGQQQQKEIFLKRLAYTSSLGCRKLLQNTFNWMMDQRGLSLAVIKELCTETLIRICSGTTSPVSFSIPPSFTSKFTPYSSLKGNNKTDQ